MARIFDEQSDACVTGPETGNGNSDMELPLDNRKQVHPIPHEFPDEWLRACAAQFPHPVTRNPQRALFSHQKHFRKSVSG